MLRYPEASLPSRVQDPSVAENRSLLRNKRVKHLLPRISRMSTDFARTICGERLVFFHIEQRGPSAVEALMVT